MRGVDYKFNIKPLREIKGLSIEDVASELGVSWKSISDWEKLEIGDKKDISLTNFCKLCTLFKVKPSDLVRDEKIKDLMAA